MRRRNGAEATITQFTGCSNELVADCATLLFRNENEYDPAVQRLNTLLDEIGTNAPDPDFMSHRRRSSSPIA
jgi:hypothetical protein